MSKSTKMSHIIVLLWASYWCSSINFKMQKMSLCWKKV